MEGPQTIFPRCWSLFGAPTWIERSYLKFCQCLWFFSVVLEPVRGPKSSPLNGIEQDQGSAVWRPGPAKLHISWHSLTMLYYLLGNLEKKLEKGDSWSSEGKRTNAGVCPGIEKLYWKYCQIFSLMLEAPSHPLSMEANRIHCLLGWKDLFKDRRLCVAKLRIS